MNFLYLRPYESTGAINNVLVYSLKPKVYLIPTFNPGATSYLYDIYKHTVNFEKEFIN